MSEYLSSRKRNLNIGISSYTENKLVLDVIGNTNITGVTSLASAGGITTTGGDLYVGGTIFLRDITLTPGTIETNYLNVSVASTLGIASASSLIVSGITTIGEVTISPLGFVTSTNPGVTTVTYYGDGSNLLGVKAFSVVNQEITTDPVYLTFANNIGVSSIGISTEQLVFIPSTGSIGLGTTTPSAKLDIVGDVRVSGVVTATTFVGNLTGIASTATKLETTRTFEITGDIVAAPQNFNGTQNVSLASSIQPNSVGLGTYTYGDYVKNITGTTGEIEVSVTFGEGVSPQIGLPNDVTIGSNLTISNDLQVNRNLNVTGNITVGGTSAYLIVNELRIQDRDIIVGYVTDAYGNDGSTDFTANHGGIAVASTEGTPLLSLRAVGFNSLPDTYKQIMWVKENTFAGLNTDAWMFNYGVGIGSTQIPSGVRLAVGGVQVTDFDIPVVRNINASGIITASQFVGNLTGTATTATNVIGGIGSLSSLSVSGITTVGFLTASNISVSGVVTATTFYGNLTGGTADIANYATNAGISTSVIGGIGSLSSLSVSGITTLGITSTTNLTTQNLNASGITTVGFLTASNISVSGVVTATTFYGNLTGGTADTATNVIGGIGSVTQLSVSGVSTVGFLTASNISVSGIVTASSFVGNLTGTATTATNLSDADNITTGTINSARLSGTYNINVSYANTSGISTVAQGLTGTPNITVGIVTASSFVGPLTGTATTATNVSGGIGSVSSLSVTGFSTLSNISVASSIFDSTNSSGVSQYVLTSTPTGILWQSVTAPSVGAIAGINVATSSVDSSFNIGFFNVGSGTTSNAFVAPSDLTYNPSRTFVGIGTTNPTSKLTISGALRSQALGIGSEFIVSNTGSFVPSVSIAATIGSGTTEKVLLRSISRNQGTLDIVSNYRQTQMMNVSDTNSEGVFRVTALETSTVAFVAPIYRQLLVVGESGIVTTRNAVAIATANATSASGTVGADIYGNVNIRSPFSTSTSYVAIAPNFRDRGALSFEAPIGAASTNSVTQLFSITNNVSSSIFRINDLSRNPILEANIAGNIGIGTTSPQRKLEVQGITRITSVGSTANEQIDIRHYRNISGFATVGMGSTSFLPTNNSGAISFESIIGYSGCTASLFALVNDPNGSIFSVAGFNPQRFASDPRIPALEITQSGNIGIGTTNPQAKLDVSGSLRVSGISTFSNGPVLIGAATSTGTALQRLQVTGGAYVSGNLGIGTTNPIQPVQIGFGTNVVVIDSIGEIGIGTTNPTSKFHVVGDARVGINTSQGIILTSPNGTTYRLFVSDAGTVSTVLVV
jgi:hypothetical protein